MKSEFQPHCKGTLSTEMEVKHTFNILDILEFDCFFDQGNVADFGTNAHAHDDGAASANHHASQVLDGADNVIYRRSPMDSTSDDTNRFTISLQTTTNIKPEISRQNGYTAFDNITLFGISISVIVHTLFLFPNLFDIVFGVWRLIAWFGVWRFCFVDIPRISL